MRDDDLCKILELLLWHRLLTHACHHLTTQYNTDDINQGQNYHIFDMLSKGELVFVLVEVHPWWACRLHPWLKQRWKMNSATAKYHSLYWKIWSGEKFLLIKLLECFQELLLALTWPPFQTQSDHLEKIQWTQGWFLTLLAAWQFVLLWQIRWTQVNRSFCHQTPPSPSSRSRLLWNTMFSTNKEWATNLHFVFIIVLPAGLLPITLKVLEASSNVRTPS